MRVHESALRHGIGPEDAIQAASWPLWIEDLDEDNPARQLRLGFDTRGRLLETVVLVFDSGNELVIHAMSRDERRRITAAEARALKDDPADLAEVRAIQLATVDLRRLTEPVGFLTIDEMQRVDDALALVLDL